MSKPSQEKSRRSTWPRLWRLAALPVLLVVGCGEPEKVTVREPVISGDRVPLVLTEDKVVALPPSPAPNRFVRGWWPYGGKGNRRQAAFDVARLQGVNLAGVRRQLVMAADETAGKRTVEVKVEGGDWERFEVGRKLHVPLPRTLPLGRFVVDIRALGGEPFGVRNAAFNKAADAGEVEFLGEDVVQSGFSIVENVLRVDGQGTLTGAFRPPQDALPQQQFSLRVREGDEVEEREVFAWSREEPVAELEFSIPVESTQGWLGVRMIALGSGPAARWQNVAVESRALPPPETEVVLPRKPKFVLLYIMDALRRDHLGHLGGPEGISPTIDRLAAEGATFDNYFSIAPNTVPSMKSMLTGRVFFDTGHYRLPDESTTLAERFWETGYRTALFSSNGNVSSWRGLTQGYEHTAKGLLFGRKKEFRPYNNSAEKLHEAALGWLESIEPEEPVFMHIQTIHPHNPYDPPEPFLSRFASGVASDEGSQIDGRTPTLLDITHGRRDASEADIERISGLYAGGVAYNDHHLEPFLERLLERYEPEDILVIITSDHGDELYEHKSLLHGFTLYDEQLAVPLVVWWPGNVEAGVIGDTSVSLDLHATLAALISQEGADLGGGRSLWPLLLESGSERRIDEQEIVFAAASSLKGGIFMARSERLKSIYAPRVGREWGMGSGKGRTRDPEFLFDLVDDAAELDNIAGERRLEADWLRSKLGAWIEAGKRLEKGAPLEDMDEETRESLRALGYLQ